MTGSSVRSVSISLGLLLLALAALEQVHGAPAAKRPVFARRALVPSAPDGVRARQAFSFAARTSWLNQLLEPRYRSLIPGRSLLVHDCEVAGRGSSWCLQNEFSFASIWRRVTGPAADAAAAAWLQSTESIPRFRRTLEQQWDGQDVNKAPFHLLAVVNRLDLADSRERGQRWRNAELRFIYGLTSPGVEPPKATLIVELVLAEMDWRNFRLAAHRWQQLSSEKCSGAHYTGCLRDLVANLLDQGVAGVRIRVNSGIDNAGPWNLAQWELRNGIYSRQALTDEISPACQSGATAGSPACAAYAPIWTGWTKSRRRYPIDEQSGLLVMDRQYGFRQNDDGSVDGLSTPEGMCSPNLEARQVLGLQTCSGCHAGETQTRFTHVSNRLPYRAGAAGPRRAATLSAFLTGGRQVLPTFAELASPNRPVHVATVRFRNRLPKATGACGDVISRVDREHSDLVRRALFLSAVLIAPSGVRPGAIFHQLINDYGPDFSH